MELALDCNDNVVQEIVASGESLTNCVQIASKAETHTQEVANAAKPYSSRELSTPQNSEKLSEATTVCSATDNTETLCNIESYFNSDNKNIGMETDTNKNSGEPEKDSVDMNEGNLDPVIDNEADEEDSSIVEVQSQIENMNVSSVKLLDDKPLNHHSQSEATTFESKLSESIANQSEDSILEPLSFPEKHQDDDKTFEASLIEFSSKYAANETPCMLCGNTYKDIGEKSQNDEYLCHLVVEHKLVIADVKLISNLRSYALYWKRRFAEEKIEEFCAAINTNMSPKDVHESERYYLLCDALAEDRKLREDLQLAKLKELIDIQTKERENDEFERICLFCTKFFIGNRSQLFNHLNEDHNFNVGHPHNLIYVEEFLDEIEKKLSSLECLFCDKVFKDRASLREHMRKKSHRRLNPKNKLYDKYYIINYLELGKNWEVLQGEPDQLESPEDWSGWEDEGVTAVCFFCSAAFSTQDRVFEHMSESHEFDFPQMRKDMNLSFYQQVKMINYIRRVVHQVRSNEKREINAAKDPEGSPEDNTPSTPNEIARSVKECILSTTKWNQPQYYFPTYENDNLLCQLEDKEGLFEPEDNFIIGEDGIDCKAIINESILTDLVVQGYFD